MTIKLEEKDICTLDEKLKKYEERLEQKNGNKDLFWRLWSRCDFLEPETYAIERIDEIIKEIKQNKYIILDIHDQCILSEN